MKLSLLMRANKIGCYFPDRGEVDLRPLMHWIWQLDRPVYLPVLHPFRQGHLLFCATYPSSWLRLNHYGIPEPESRNHSEILTPVNLDVVVTPLVAFDASKHRLGMGGGYYDRTFWRRARERSWRHPRLIGVGYEFQKVDRILKQPWDVPLDLVVTEQTVY